MTFVSIPDSYGQASGLNSYWHHVEYAVRCCNLAPPCYLHANANSGPRHLFGEWLAIIFSVWMCTRMADALMSARHLHRSPQTLPERLRGQGATPAGGGGLVRLLRLAAVLSKLNKLQSLQPGAYLKEFLE